MLGSLAFPDSTSFVFSLASLAGLFGDTVHNRQSSVHCYVHYYVRRTGRWGATKAGVQEELQA